MTKEQAKEFYPILQAYAEGRAIECRTKPSALKDENVPNEWIEMKEIEYWSNIEYRIKSDSKAEAKFRPFNTAEECWAEMQKHQPIGWIKDWNDNRDIIGGVSSDDMVFVCEDGTFDFDNMFKNYTFADGVPFGVKVEE